MITNTCNSARNLSSLLVEDVTKICEEKSLEKGEYTANVLIMRTYCYNHLRNVWIGSITKHISKYLDDILDCDLEAIESSYRVSTIMDDVLRSIDKEFSLPENYPKGHGYVFKNWMKKCHPGALLVPVARTSGSQQDLAVEGAAAVYWNRRYYVPFLYQCLGASKENILQKNLFYILTSEEIIALTRVFAIFHFTVCMPM